MKFCKKNKQKNIRLSSVLNSFEDSIKFTTVVENERRIAF